MSQKPLSSTPRATYRHGDLRRALLEAGMELARAGGPEAVVLREATRRAGVTPNAAYRHFAGHEDLLAAVRDEAVAAVARAMEAEHAAVPAGGTPTEQARARVRAVGAGYLRFAFTETGLFRTAFGGRFQLGGGQTQASRAGASGLNPFEHLNAALDALVASGALPAERRPGAEYLAWSTVHGLALLALDGPLRAVSPPQLEALSQRVLDLVERGM